MGHRRVRACAHLEGLKPCSIPIPAPAAECRSASLTRSHKRVVRPSLRATRRGLCVPTDLLEAGSQLCFCDSAEEFFFVEESGQDFVLAPFFTSPEPSEPLFEPPWMGQEFTEFHLVRATQRHSGLSYVRSCFFRATWISCGIA